MIDRDLKQATAFHEQKQAIGLEEEKLRVQQKATERATFRSIQLDFERKRLELQQ